jgi:predicted ribosomally synthesized peptide with nif11-like leader
MTATAAETVIDRMETDEAFAQRVKDAGGPEASIALLRGDGFDVTPQDMRDAVLDRFGDLMTEEQLDSIAAGYVTGSVVGDSFLGAGIGVAGGAVLVVTACAVAAV